MTPWNAVLWLHLLAMAFFVGGQVMLAAVVVPTLRRLPDRGPLRSAARRFGLGTLIALSVLIGTGVAMATHNDSWGSTALQVKLGLVVLVGILIAAHMRWPAVAANPRSGAGAAKPRSGALANPRSAAPAVGHALEGAIFLVSLAIVWLGIVVAGG